MCVSLYFLYTEQCIKESQFISEVQIRPGHILSVEMAQHKIRVNGSNWKEIVSVGRIKHRTNVANFVDTTSTEVMVGWSNLMMMRQKGWMDGYCGWQLPRVIPTRYSRADFWLCLSAPLTQIIGSTPVWLELARPDCLQDIKRGLKENLLQQHIFLA